MHLRNIGAFFVILATGTQACGGSSKNNEAVRPGVEVSCPDGSVNAGKKIVTMDCNTVVQFEGNEFEASLDVAKYATAGLHNAPKVMREIDQAATDAQLQFTQTCRVYNSCQMPSEKFQAELSHAQEQFRSLREKVSLLQASGGDPAVLRQTVAELYTEAVPQERRRESTLAANLVVQVKDAGQQTARILRDGDTIHTGAKVVVGLQVSQPAYVYVFQRHQDKGLDVLFPNEQIQNLHNPIAAQELVRIPPGGQVFTLNNEDLGAEQLHVAVSLRPLADLESALQNSGASQQGEPVEKAMASLFDEGNPHCEEQHRGLEVSQDECASMTRGLELANSGSDDFFSGESSQRAQSAPGDDVVMQTLSFNHAP